MTALARTAGTGPGAFKAFSHFFQPARASACGCPLSAAAASFARCCAPSSCMAYGISLTLADASSRDISPIAAMSAAESRASPGPCVLLERRRCRARSPRVRSRPPGHVAHCSSAADRQDPCILNRDLGTYALAKGVRLPQASLLHLMQATSVINSLYDRLDNPEYLTMAQVVQLDGLRLREFVLPQQECWQRLHAHADLLSVLPEVTKPGAREPRSVSMVLPRSWQGCRGQLEGFPGPSKPARSRAGRLLTG